MSEKTEKTECKELSKGRAYMLKIGGVEISALKLEGYKASQLGGTVSPLGVGASGSKAESDDWLLVVKDKEGITMPYDVWAAKVASVISKASGSNVGTISVVSGEVVTSGSWREKRMSQNMSVETIIKVVVYGVPALLIVLGFIAYSSGYMMQTFTHDSGMMNTGIALMVIGIILYIIEFIVAVYAYVKG
jgi:hypothetical protein